MAKAPPDVARLEVTGSAERAADVLDLIRARRLAKTPHGFFGRRGGLSTGVFAGLNAGLGSGDDRGIVTRNRARAAEAVLPGAPLLGVYQIHSAQCVTAGDSWDAAARPHADALVTDRPGVLLAILTADCAPVLLADVTAGVIGAAHAGWKGALAGVIQNTVAAMVTLGARSDAIAAAIGPCIAQPSYEVDDGFRDRFLAASSANARFFVPTRAGHALFSLENYVAAQLRAAGVDQVETLSLDTYAAPDRFYSFRRATHRGEPAYGRQISIIGMAGDS